jgi:hypothetical protein
MPAPVRRALGLSLLSICVAQAGCDATREDRTIEFSADAGAVGFQHGEQGVFVAAKDGKGLTKVFEPGADVLATSTPLWAPKGRRLIFATARAADGVATDSTKSQVPLRAMLRGGADPDPAGDLFAQVPVAYTCWLRDEASGGPPVKLFDAKCDHVGYVAANLAVRWHPQADRVLFVNALPDGNHSIFVYDLKSKSSRRIFPPAAKSLIFDWSPDGKHLACVLRATSATSGSDRDGLWIGEPDREHSDWWHVPGSGEPAGANLEQLRATRPAWTGDGAMFAFVTRRAAAAASDPGESRLWIGALASHHVEQVAADTAGLSDLHWSPRGEQLGLVRTSTEPVPVLAAGATVRSALALIAAPMSTLHVWTRAGGVSEPLNARPVRRFAGWCAAGDHLAYVSPDDVLGAKRALWSFLLVPNPLSRDAVVIAAGDAKAAGKLAEEPAFSGLRVTFPHWSPTAGDEVLSLWCTFSPSHSSLLARLLGGGLRSGDPAALLNARSGAISWMAVSPVEEAQVGHYHQLKREYGAAWQRYERADAGGLNRQDRTDPTDHDAKASPTAGAEPRNPMEWLSGLFSPRGIAVFQFHCLDKLGRHEEARTRLDQFRQSYPPWLPAQRPAKGATAPNDPDLPPEEPWVREVLGRDRLCARLLQDLYIAEVLLSLDSDLDARDYFRTVLDARAGQSDTARLSAAVVLAQILLLEGKRDAYAELATETLAPLLLKLRPALAVIQPGAGTLELTRHIHDLAGGLALLPLASEAFLSELSSARLKSTAERWESLRHQANDDSARLAADLILQAAYRQLGQEAKARLAADRLEHNPARATAGTGSDLAHGGADQLIESIRAVVSGAAFSMAGGQ